MAQVYKICTTAEWLAFQSTGEFAGSAVDQRDGFIHFSAEHQVSETARKHFAGQQDLVLLSVNTNTMGDRLKWEPSRGGDLFPHLYDVLRIATVATAIPLKRDTLGQVELPEPTT